MTSVLERPTAPFGAAANLTCRECGATYDLGPGNACEQCFGPLEIGYDESLPFPCGYGVEFGLLIDTYRSLGLDAMAQVDLSRRKHRNQDLHKLGRMAIEILQVAERRLRRDVVDPAVLTQFTRSGDGYRVIETDMTERERPPIASIARR
jgi:hypothetical protein